METDICTVTHREKSENIKLILVEEQAGMQGLFRRYAYYYYMHINLSNFLQPSSSEVFSNLLLI